MLNHNGSPGNIPLENGFLMVLKNWEPFVGLFEVVKKEFGIECVFVTHCDNAYIFFVKTKDEEVFQKVVEYAIFRNLPNRACLD